ncbi:MAG: hypothetical protein COA42_18530 [Alteromonadaceae bacterium]|nr:MAG: hypothetical protein COA42_18530 [Alteromonadaceae bacterium]
MRSKFLIGFICCLYSSLSFSDCQPHACVDEYIEKIYTNTNGTVYIATSGDETKLNCTPESGIYLTLLLSEPAGEAIYSTLLAAQIANKKMLLRVNEGTSGCKVAYVTLEKQ